MDKKLVVVLVLVVIISAGISYTIGVSKYKGALTSKETQISHLEESIRETKTASTPKSSASAAEVIMDEEVNCLLCHDLSKTKAFHVPESIMKIDERAGKRRRTCVDCHGPLGPPWSSDKQLTPISDITFDETVGVNGILEIDSNVPHSIHQGKIDSGVVRCQTCHGDGAQMIVPEADTNSGQVLVCQNCKFHPEEGNYITIHVELAAKKCTLCHTGGIISVHKERTANLGLV